MRIGIAAGKMAGIWFGVKAPFVLLLVATPPAAVFSWLQAGDAAQMIGTAFKRTPDKVVQAL
jgi:hypothetical protein